MKKLREVKLNEQEIANAYADALRFVSRSRHIKSDEARQYIADALREFYDLLQVRISLKRSAPKSNNEESSKEIADAKIA